ncbi:MAG TPA: HEAT repeat domain-containing protein [Phototrophicaceae bacterium]|nr:HEAT repeat domain-containing protein [Phototrophicaceae bacterium]
MAAHQCLEKPRNAPKNWQASAQKLVAAFVSGSEKEQVFLWSALLEQGAQVVPFLVAALHQEQNPETRCRIISALWETKDQRAVDPLLDCLGDPHEKVRAYAACGLGWLQDNRSIPALMNCLNDPQLRVRWFAAIALERFGRVVVETLRTALRDPRTMVRVGAANILGWMMNSRSVDALVAALDDDDEFVRMQAAAALGWSRDVRAIAPLTRLIDDKSEWTRYVAIQALADIGDQQVIEPLNAALNSPHIRVQEAADQALRRLADTRL